MGGIVIHLESSDGESTAPAQSEGVSGIASESSRPIGRMGGNVDSIAKRARTEEKEKEGDAEKESTGGIFDVFREIRRKRNAGNEVANSSTRHPIGVSAEDNANLAHALVDMARETRNGFPDICGECGRLATALRYLAREATISGYRLRKERKLALLLIADGGNWRAHNLQTFCYPNGCWAKVDCLSVSCSRFLAALEGLFISLADSKAQWEWDCVADAARCVLGECSEECANQVKLINVAKVRSDHTRIGTSNKTYRSHWCERFEDSIQAYLVELDRSALVEDLAKVFLKKCDSPKPKSGGYCFTDVYVGDNFQEMTRSRSAN